MPTFTKRSQQPLTPSGYRRIAKALRETADGIDDAERDYAPYRGEEIGKLLRALSKRTASWLKRHQDTINGTLKG